MTVRKYEINDVIKMLLELAVAGCKIPSVEIFRINAISAAREIDANYIDSIATEGRQTRLSVKGLVDVILKHATPYNAPVDLSNLASTVSDFDLKDIPFESMAAALYEEHDDVVQGSFNDLGGAKREFWLSVAKRVISRLTKPSQST